ncbi:bifunctional 2-polyprenyl-6-hydroxyphenol methylase/3-demethylubiquinol 3-O-methyltransferase UbiG [Nocardioides sp.]|uniref:class I SAM-dependent methyltransferase n=1 Tax=Nocardioides sp. TaxID=35761 RepID=UPI0027342205|nr:methyltransferase domain-containing protein [Nocardioides sp.]MDP3894585.1 methyltransferase domain-containing protein [Nocardioides sp.]
MSDPGGPPVDAVIAAQNAGHGEGHDYDKGSPHLRHTALRTMVESRLEALVADSLARTGRCRVLEVGAGHGTFTRCLLEAGASITVTEASSASAAELRQTFGDRIEVIYDETGEGILSSGREWDLAVMTAVLHHIPDYLTFLDRLCGLIASGGGVFAVADPLYYPRLPALVHRADRGAYLAWRVFQGEFKRGIATRIRRLRGVYDESEPSDLVEYHVVRDGVDELAIRDLLAPRFADFDLFTYWASQAPLFQRLGARTSMCTDFGFAATGLVRD